MKLIYGYQDDGKFLIAVVRDELSEMLSQDPTGEIDIDVKATLTDAARDGESFVEFSRKDGNNVAKHLVFGKKGDLRVLDMES